MVDDNQKILITGSRTAPKPWEVNESLKKEIKQGNILIHGGALGIDQLAECWARQNDIESICIRPVRTDIGNYYLHRNAEMIGMCDKVIAFWDGKSRGTKFTIDYAKARNKKVLVFHI